MSSTPSKPTFTKYSDRDIRQREIIPPEKLAACHAVVVGVGAIGRQVALQLAAVGIGTMDLFDPDTVGEENLAPQGYWQQDVGLEKAQATGDACRLINPFVQLVGHPERFRRSSPKDIWTAVDPDGVVVIFCCVDSITTRALVWESVRANADLFLDGRMSAEVIRVLTSPLGDTQYASTLFAPERAYGGSCTAKSTIYTASIAAGLMLGQFTRWLRGLPIDRDLSLNLLASELTTAGEVPCT